MFEDITPEQKERLVELLKRSASADKAEALQAQADVAAALEIPLKSAPLAGSTLGNIFEETEFEPNADIVFPIDFYTTDNADDFKAYVIPDQGKIPLNTIEGDEVRVPTYRVANSIDFPLKYARHARFDLISRALEVMEAGFVQKINDDGWHAILKAGFERGFIVSDENASAGEFTRALLSSMKTTMRRKGGGTSTSANRSILTHLFVSPEAMEDMRSWGDSEVDEITRREIYLAGEDGELQIDKVTIAALDEFGEDQVYNEYFKNVVGKDAAHNGLASATDVEVVVGLDVRNNDAFVMPIREPLSLHADDTLHRQQLQGYYGWTERGTAVLNNARVILGSL